LDSISDDLPNVEKDIGEVDLDEVDDLEYESSFNFSIIIGILIVLVLFAIVGVVAWLALKD
jgi:hypothetical protein